MVHASVQLQIQRVRVAAVSRGIMARTGFCDSRQLLDLHMTDDRLVPLRTWANSCVLRERRVFAEGEEVGSGQHYKPAQESRWVRRTPISAEDGIIMDYAPQDESGPSDVYEEEALLKYLNRLPGPSLRELMPELLRREVEVAISKLGLLYDKTYAWDIFSDMMRSQLLCALPNADLPKHFSDTTRAILVDWLIQVHEVFQFSEETLYLAVHLLNRALRLIKVSISGLQLLGVVCLFLAAKKEECLLPEVSELCYLMENAYSKKQLLRMERRVLTGLKFDLYHCPPLNFLLISASIARCSDKVVWMARYLLELSLLEGQCVVYLPAQLAGAALRLARRILQEAPSPDGEMAWCIASSIHIGSEATLLRIMPIMATAAARAHGRETRATFIKFSTIQTLHVSMHPALKATPGLLGLSCPQT
ncbi:cyclin N-terminal domain-containing protein 2-like isoform X2 [Sinocyclocheilus rhinocerous]|uniref:Cyclin N-terminal domain-containing protein 2-like n=1 Tax=Sinocyclocheilus rhinocerous TaxID=307959 RepID=A0A673JN38_9TELE|nr:PREDICTED: cyclin N-terminal domain-containing protein 2-like isoform X2 [Sinocyclocheilus rhinocerous]